MFKSRTPRGATLLVALATLLCSATLRAQIEPSAEVLMPQFAVDLQNPLEGDVSLFAVTAHDQAALVGFTVYTNWGIPVLETFKAMAADEVVTVNLRDWIVSGQLLDRHLPAGDLARLQAQLSGERSPEDGLYYGTRVRPGLAVGYVIARTLGAGRPHNLWGDYSSVVGELASYQSDTLVNVDLSLQWNLPCKILGIRYLAGVPWEDTHLTVWSAKQAQAQSGPNLPDGSLVHLKLEVYDETGNHLENRNLALLPMQTIHVKDLLPPLPAKFGWLEFELDTEGVVLADLNASDRRSAALHAYCLPQDEMEPTWGPHIHLTKLVNGEDADAAPGPMVAVGSPLVWTFVVANTGSVPLKGIALSDSFQSGIQCPADELQPGVSFTCTAASNALACQHENVAQVSGMTDAGEVVTDSDVANYYGQVGLGLQVAVFVNDLPAGQPNLVHLGVGVPITWKWVVTNSGQTDLTGVTLTSGAQSICSKPALLLGESMTCTLDGGLSLPGTSSKAATAAGTGPCGDATSADITGYYSASGGNVWPVIQLKKYVNDVDADVAPGPQVQVGSTLSFRYHVTNPGPLALAQVAVTDDTGITVTCPKTSLAIDESMDCTATSTAVVGQHQNIGTATGTTAGGLQATATDPANYDGIAPPAAAIDIEKLINGQDADLPPGPTVVKGSTLSFSYVVTNIGEVELTNVLVSDNVGLVVTCPKTVLQPSESMTCTAQSTALLGQHQNIGTASGEPAEGPVVTDTDPAYYTGTASGQGCTPGYWKNHTDSWPPAGYVPSQTVVSVFSAAASYPALGSSTLLQALSFDGGSGLSGAAEILLRAGVSALLNAAHPGVSYPRTPADVIADVNAALASGNRDTMLVLAASLDADNNLGCPLN